MTLCVVQVMKQIWSADELGEHWTVSHDEFALLKGKTAIGRLAVAVQLKHYQAFARFAQTTGELSPDTIEYISDQVETPANSLIDYGIAFVRYRSGSTFCRRCGGDRMIAPFLVTEII